MSAEQVLIVDDNPANLDVLRQVLGTHQYKVRVVPSGKLALQSARHTPPDVVLMDVNMPEMDGYQTCEAFKTDPALADIPVIFISALDGVVDKVRAFQAGGADYLSKPFHAEEVVLRVRHQAQLRRLQQELAERNRTLENANLRLLEVDKLKGSFTAMLVHDLRSPLAALQGFLDLYQEGGCTEQRLLDRCQHSLNRMIGMLNDLLEVYRSEGKDMPLDLASVNLATLMHDVQQQHLPQCRKQEITLACAPPAAALPVVQADAVKVERALGNLMANALKFTPSGGTITLGLELIRGSGVEEGLNWLMLKVEDTGRGIPAEEVPYIFDPYRQAVRKDANLGVGLGLAIVQRIMAAHGGRITVRSQLGVGSSFTMFFPVTAPEAR